MLDFLPHDVLIDILTKLPIKTLVRFACVCKSWYSFFTNPSFITTHLNHRSSLINNNLLLIRRQSVDGKGLKYSLLRCENEMFCDYTELKLPRKSHKDHSLRIIDSCNGLVCLSDDFCCCMGKLYMCCCAEKLYLWNPSIQKRMVLPPSPRVTSFPYGGVQIGFGFDSLTDDYKVVRIEYPDLRIPPVVDIFTLSTGTWRNMSHLGVAYAIYAGETKQAYLNGAAHWLACTRLIRSNSNFFYLIVSFHMGDEVFGEIMLPGGIFRDHGENVRVAKFQESLSLITGHWPTETCCIWVMKEYGISESWTKQFNIDTSGGSFYSFAGFTKKDQVLFWLYSGYLAAYDPEAERVMRLHICGSIYGWSRDLFYVDSYTESLVLLGAKFRDTVTCEESPVSHGGVSGAKKSRKRSNQERKEEGCDQDGKLK